MTGKEPAPRPASPNANKRRDEEKELELAKQIIKRWVVE